MSDTNLKLAVFDCDGTIVDSQYSIIHAMHVAFSKFEYPLPDRDTVRRVVGLPLLDIFSLLLPEEGQERHEEMREAYSDEWRKLRSRNNLSEHLYPGFVESLDALEGAGWLLGVATGKSYRGLNETLDTHNLLDRFVTLQTADRARGKPHPEMLFKAMDEAGTSPENTVMIGDTTFDIEMSVNAGVRAIGVNWGYHDGNELLASGADVVLDDYSELVSALSPQMEI
jgi:phosphoglycolate phosphatase